MYKTIFKGLFLLVLNVNYCFSQYLHTTNNNIWLSYNGDHKFSKKFGLHLEFQERRSEMGAKNQQHFFRTGLNYHFLPNATATIGYGFAETYPYGEFAIKSKFPEHRIYQQLQYSTSLERVEAISRFRLEQRFSYLPLLADNNYKSNKSATYTNRFRFMQRFSMPFKGQKIIEKTFYLTINDEFFINFGKNLNKNIFDQNRVFVGVGYKIPKVGRLECGYLNQTIFKGDGIKVENNHTLIIALNANFEMTKAKK